MSANRKEPDFVVTDRRKFTEEGVRREEAPESAPEIPAADTARVVSEKFSKEDVERQTGRAAPSEAEQATQHADYRAGSQRLDDLLQERTGQRAAAAAEMTFERLVASLYMTAMMQLGMMVPEGEEPRIDILGARQTIDTLGILNEKTKGNLTPAEQTLLQQTLFELRMAFLEFTNAIARTPPPGAPAAGGKK